MTPEDGSGKAAPTAGGRRRPGGTHLVPTLVVLCAIISALVLYVWDRDAPSPAPQPNYRADAPPPPAH